MSTEKSELPDTPRQAFERYIVELENEYLPWYARAANTNKIWWVIGQSTAIVATGATVFIAGLVDKDLFTQYRWLLVLLPLVGSFATTMLAQTRVRDILALREAGREHVQALISKAKVNFAALKDNEVSEAHAKLVDEVSRIEKSQAANILSIANQVGK
jgi:hypothetical protein